MVSVSQIEAISKRVKVVALSRKFLRSAAIVLLIGRGSYSDQVEGCACLASRMRLRLTSKLGPIRLHATMDRLGATVDTTIDRDLVLLRAQLPSEKVQKCLRFLADLFTMPCFTESEVAKEKASQKLEYDRIRQDPVTAAIDDAWEATFPKSPLGHPVTGFPHTVEKLNPRILEESDAETRQKASLVIGIVGPQRETVLIDHVRSFFGEFQNSPRVGRLRARSRHDFKVLRRTLDAKQTTFAVGMMTPGVSSAEYPALLLIEDYLSSNRHYFGVLTKELREKRGLTYFAHTRLSPLRDCGLLAAFAGVGHEKVSEALRLMLSLMIELRDKPLESREVERVKTFHKQVMVTNFEAPYQAATWLAASVFRGGRTDLDSYFSDIDGVSPDTIMRAAGQFLTPSHMGLSVAGNPPHEESLMKIMREEVE